MFNFSNLIYVQLLGAFLSILSFLVFTSAFRTSKNTIVPDNELEWVEHEDDNDNTDEHSNISILTDKKYSAEEEILNKYNTQSLFKSAFNQKLFSKKNKDSREEDEISNNESSISTPNTNKESEEFYDEDFLFEDSFDEKLHLQEKDEQIDDEVYEDFPHEKSAVSIFSKDHSTDIEISDIKELISTIKEEFKH